MQCLNVFYWSFCVLDVQTISVSSFCYLSSAAVAMTRTPDGKSSLGATNTAPPAPRDGTNWRPKCPKISKIYWFSLVQQSIPNEINRRPKCSKNNHPDFHLDETIDSHNTQKYLRSTDFHLATWCTSVKSGFSGWKHWNWCREREIGGYKKGERLRLSVIARHGVRPGPEEVTDYSCSQKRKGFRVTLQDPKTSP